MVFKGEAIFLDTKLASRFGGITTVSNGQSNSGQSWVMFFLPKMAETGLALRGRPPTSKPVDLWPAPGHYGAIIHTLDW